MVQQGPERREIFVGRGDEQAHYQKFLHGEDRQWLLLLTGIPGIGKTTLLRRFQAHTPGELGTILLNFDDADPSLRTNPLQVLQTLAGGAKDICQRGSYEECMRMLHEGRERLKQFKKRLEKQLELHNQRLSDPRELAQIKQRLLAAERETQQDVREDVMEAFFAQIETLETAGVVLLFDTCERLNEPASWEVGKWLLGEFLPELHAHLGRVKKTCFVVLASRVPPAFDVLQEQEQRRLQLELLPKEEAFEYLELAGLETRGDQSEGWKERLYKITHGHPLSLSIIRELWRVEDANPSSDEDAELDAFQSRFEDTVSIEFVEQRILDRLDPAFRILTEGAVVLRSFNREQLQRLFPEVLSESEARKRFDQFVSYSYIESIGGYRYIFHEFIRGVLARYTQAKYPETWKHYHRVALDAVANPDSPDRYYHWIATNETEGVQAWQEAVEQAQLARDGQAIGELVQVARDKTLHLSLSSQAIISEKAEQLHQESGQDEAAAEAHNQTEQLKHGIEQEARALQGQGDEQRERGDLKAALASYRDALQRLQHVGDHAEDEARLQEAIHEIEQPQTVASTPATGKDVPDGETRRIPLSFLRKRPVVAAGVSLLILALVFLLIFLSIFRGGPTNPFPPQLPPGVGVTQLSSGELIGVSNGAFAFDANCRTGNPLKCQAASRFRDGDIAGAESMWNRELAVNTNDAETLIYLEDQQVQNSPHITLVVATTLTGASVNLGRDDLQGAYVAQKEYNDGLKLSNGMRVSLLIANFGGDPGNATRVAQQIAQAAHSDKTIVGVMGLPLSAYVPAAIAILQNAHLPLISSGAGSDALSSLSPFFFRVVPPDAVQAQVGATYARQTLHAHTVALFYDPGDISSTSLAKDFEHDFTGLGGIVHEQIYTAGQPETILLQLQNLLKSPPDLLYFAGSATDMNTVLVHLPLSSKLEIMGSSSLYQPQDYSTALRSGLYFTAFASPDEWNILCHSGLSQTCPTPSFFGVYSAAFGGGRLQKQYGYTLANSSTITSYDALSVLLTAYQLAIPKGQNLQAALKLITGSQAFQGVSGQISLDGNGDPLKKATVILFVDANGDIRLASSNQIQGCFLISQCGNP